MLPIDVSKLKLRVLPLEDKKKANEKLRAAGENGGSDGAQWDRQYDPHLHEEKRRCDRKQPPTLTIAKIAREKPGEKKATFLVDVIAQLKSDGFVPTGLTLARPLGDQIFTGDLDIEKVEEVRPQVASLKAATDLSLHLYNSVPAIECDPASLDRSGGRNFPGLDGSGVLVGVVDVGCDFRHKNFRHPSGATRIRFLWDQSKDADPDQPQLGKNLGDYNYGREFDSDLINKALNAGEETAYQALGYTPTPAAHGTHVMDIAAGNGRELARFGGQDGPITAQPSHPGVAPNAQLIFVHLKTFEERFLGNSRHLLEAVEYIFRKADELKLPAVVNLSVSTSGGPHDGSTLVEKGLQALVEAKPGRAIVTSAGNSYLQQGHVSGKIGKGESRTLLWYTDPRHMDPDTTKNEMEIWYPGSQELEMTLSAPGGTELAAVPLKRTADLLEGTRRVGRVTHRFNDPNNQDNQIDIRVPHVGNQPWEIKLTLKEVKAASDTGEARAEGTKKAEIEFHAWIEQDDHGLSRFGGETDSDYTLSSISCSKATLTVGAFDTALNACMAPPLGSTSAGPTRSVKREDKLMKRDKPDLSAPGVSVVAARAQGGVTVMSGTSMAAAHVTGLVALLFQLALRSGKGPLKFSTIRDLLTQNTSPVSDPNLALRLGSGRINGSSYLKPVIALDPPGRTVDLQPTPAVPEGLPEELPPTPDPILNEFADLLRGKIHVNGQCEDLKKIVILANELIESGKGFRISLEPLP